MKTDSERELQLVDAYLAALSRDPLAGPPSGLDPAAVALARTLALRRRSRRPDQATMARMWQRALDISRPDRASQSLVPAPAPQLHPNGRSRTRKATDGSLRGLRALPARRMPSTARFLALAAAALAVLVFGGFLMSFTGGHVGEGPETVYIPNVRTTEALFERYINQAWNEGDVTVLDELLSVDHVCYEPDGSGGMVGIPHMAEMIGNFRTAFPNWRFEIMTLTATENEVRAQLVGTGTQSAPFAYAEEQTIESGGRRVVLSVVLDARLEDGKIAEEWLVFDTADLLGQMQTDLALATHATEQRNLAAVRGLWETAIDPTKVHNVGNYYGSVIRWHMGSRTDFGAPLDSTGGTHDFLMDVPILDQMEWHREYLATFKTLNGQIDQLVAAGDFVTARVTFRGELLDWYLSPMLGGGVEPLQPGPQDVSYSWLVLFRFEDAKVVEAWVYEDLPFVF